MRENPGLKNLRNIKVLIKYILKIVFKFFVINDFIINIFYYFPLSNKNINYNLINIILKLLIR